jgi:hypothetical protein
MISATLRISCRPQGNRSNKVEFKELSQKVWVMNRKVGANALLATFLVVSCLLILPKVTSWKAGPAPDHRFCCSGSPQFVFVSAFSPVRSKHAASSYQLWVTRFLYAFVGQLVFYINRAGCCCSELSRPRTILFCD